MLRLSPRVPPVAHWPHYTAVKSARLQVRDGTARRVRTPVLPLNVASLGAAARNFAH